MSISTFQSTCIPFIVVNAEFKSQTSIEGHSIVHIVCLLTKPHSQQNSDLNETQSNKSRELNRRRSLRVSIDRTSTLRYISRVMSRSAVELELSWVEENQPNPILSSG